MAESSHAHRRVDPRPGKEESESLQPSFNVVTEEQYRKVADRLLQADLDLIDAHARLDTARLPGGTTAAEKLRELASGVEEAKRKRIGHSQYLDKLEVSLGNDNSEQLRASILKQELAYHKRLQESVKLSSCAARIRDRPRRPIASRCKTRPRCRRSP